MILHLYLWFNTCRKSTKWYSLEILFLKSLYGYLSIKQQKRSRFLSASKRLYKLMCRLKCKKKKKKTFVLWRESFVEFLMTNNHIIWLFFYVFYLVRNRLFAATDVLYYISHNYVQNDYAELVTIFVNLWSGKNVIWIKNWNITFIENVQKIKRTVLSYNKCFCYNDVTIQFRIQCNMNVK